MGGRGPHAGRNRNQSRSPAGPSLRTSEPEDVFLVSCRLPEAQRWNWLLALPGAAACWAVWPLSARRGRAQGLGCARAKLRTRSLQGTVSSPGARGQCPSWQDGGRALAGGARPRGEPTRALSPGARGCHGPSASPWRWGVSVWHTSPRPVLEKLRLSPAARGGSHAIGGDRRLQLKVTAIVSGSMSPP